MNKITYILAFANGFLFGFATAILFNVFGPEQENMSTPKYSNTLQQTISPPEMLPLAWEKDPSRKKWSQYLFTEIEKNIDILDKAKDIEYFCPNYALLKSYEKINVWGQLIAGMAYYESSFDPTARYLEPMSEYDPVTGNAIVSEGLLQLGYSDALYHGCNFNWNIDSQLEPGDPRKTILDPYRNLNCGIIILSKQIQKHGNIMINKGAYWAVIKTGHRNNKSQQIRKLISNYSMCGNYE
jgi:hypothetical protein